MSRADSILDAAGRCFARGGFHATTMVDVAQQAGCSPGLIYRYFASKDDLVTALVQRDCERIVAAINAEDEPDLVVRLRRLCAELLAETNEPGQARLHILIIAEAARDTGVTAVVRRMFDQIAATLGDALEAAQKRGEVATDQEADRLARCLVGLVEGLLVQKAVTPDLDLGDYETTLDWLLAGWRPVGAVL